MSNLLRPSPTVGLKNPYLIRWWKHGIKKLRTITAHSLWPLHTHTVPAEFGKMVELALAKNGNGARCIFTIVDRPFEVNVFEDYMKIGIANRG